MGFELTSRVSALTVFLQGMLSFFSPCVLPLLPVYLGYLSGGTMKREKDGRWSCKRKTLFINTLFFVIGISFAFFVLGFGMTAIGRFFYGNTRVFAILGGGIIILFGLYQLGFFGTIQTLSKERRFRVAFERLAMSPITALLMGFTFSFAWTPCIGPVLSSVLLMTASAGNSLTGYLLIALYTLGFVLPFVIVGFFTTTVLEWIQRHRDIVRYTEKVGGVLLLLMGILVLTGRMNVISSSLAVSRSELSVSTTADRQNLITVASKRADAAKPTEVPSEEEGTKHETEEEQKEFHPMIDLTLTDQYGEEHTLSDYEGKIIFLNFWATWCPPCRAEMPDIQKLYEEYGSNQGDEIVFFGVAAPELGGETDIEGIADFLLENGYTYPVLMDTTGQAFYDYMIRSYPTTFMITADGNIYGYLNGSMSEETMRSIITQTMEGS